MKRSFNDIAENVKIITDGGYTFDGEMFYPEGKYSITITKGPVLNFIKL